MNDDIPELNETFFLELFNDERNSEGGILFEGRVRFMSFRSDVLIIDGKSSWLYGICKIVNIILKGN